MKSDETGTNDDPSADDLPAPGSAEALERGCTCSARANRHGKIPPFAPGTAIGGSTGGWMIAANCPLHINSTYRGALIAKPSHMPRRDR